MAISTFLRGRPVENLRGLQMLSFSDTATIETPSNVDDDGGGATKIWSTGVTVPCRIYPVTKRAISRTIGGAISERSTHFLIAPAGTEVAFADRVVVPNKGTFEITGIQDSTDQFVTVVEIFRP